MSAFTVIVTSTEAAPQAWELPDIEGLRWTTVHPGGCGVASWRMVWRITVLAMSDAPTAIRLSIAVHRLAENPNAMVKTMSGTVGAFVDTVPEERRRGSTKRVEDLVNRFKDEPYNYHFPLCK